MPLLITLFLTLLAGVAIGKDKGHRPKNSDKCQDVIVFDGIDEFFEQKNALEESSVLCVSSSTLRPIDKSLIKINGKIDENNRSRYERCVANTTSLNPSGKVYACGKKKLPVCGNRNYQQVFISSLKEFSSCLNLSKQDEKNLFCEMVGESKLFANVKSSTGAKGVAQFTLDHVSAVSKKDFYGKKKCFKSLYKDKGDEWKSYSQKELLCPPHQPRLGIAMATASYFYAREMVTKSLSSPYEVKGAANISKSGVLGRSQKARILKGYGIVKKGAAVSVSPSGGKLQKIFNKAGEDFLGDIVIASHNAGRYGVKYAFRAMLGANADAILSGRLKGDDLKKKFHQYLGYCTFKGYKNCSTIPRSFFKGVSCEKNKKGSLKSKKYARAYETYCYVEHINKRCSDYTKGECSRF